ncbi:hypothetical protein JOF29_001217 [Kribbella aluminosa]|uniref:Uncharacterized protein n=1 Tax=Kribbella aluminosa TaxID=416017 RepID=A0ABS4UER8_9ACTN|nr:hypothetical protein [Kribbella aluminosa]MBP2350134.1 hypothetical protein [Kribbella aluminosa]
MGTVPYLLALVVAVVVSAQLLLTMKPNRPLAKRLRDLGTGGDAFGLLIVAILTLTATGALIGSLTNSPATGAAIGLVMALAAWTTAVIHAHRRR